MTTVVAAETWSVGVFVEATALSNSLALLLVQVLDSASNVLFEDEDYLGSVSTAGVASLLKVEGIVIPTGGVTLRYWIQLRAFAKDATGTSFNGAVMIHKGATLPTTYISGREVANHNDDNGQLHRNSIDIENMEGDFQLIKVYADMGQALTKIWAGSRHGADQRDVLFFEGEDHTSVQGTNPAASGSSNLTWSTADDTDAASSNGKQNRFGWTNNGSGGMTGQATTSVGYTEYDLGSDPPNGLFRVLARVNTVYNTSSTSAFSATLGWRLGWVYGNITQEPGDFKTPVSPVSTVPRDVIDMGVVRIPPIGATPDGETQASFKIRLHGSILGTPPTISNSGEYHRWQSDYTQLIPEDDEGNYVTQASAQEKILYDTISKSRGVWILDRSASDAVLQLADYEGIPFLGNQDGTRLHFNMDDVIADTLNIKVTVQPLYLSVG